MQIAKLDLILAYCRLFYSSTQIGWGRSTTKNISDVLHAKRKMMIGEKSRVSRGITSLVYCCSFID